MILYDLGSKVTLTTKKSLLFNVTLLGVVAAASIVVRLMSLSVGLQWLGWTQEHNRRHGDVS
jgi:uncharacterized membrane protein YqjE